MKESILRQRAFFFGMVLVLAILALILVWQFVQAILFAIAMVILLKPVYHWFLQRRWVKSSPARATGATMIFFILIIAIPAILIIGGAIAQAVSLFSGIDVSNLSVSLQEIIDGLEKTIQNVGSFQLGEFQLGESIGEIFSNLASWFSQIIISLGASLPSIFMNVIVVLIIMYVMLPRYRSPGKQEILEIVPFPAEITQLFLDKIDLMIKAMFKGTFVIAITQGLAMGLVLWIAGVPFVMFLTLLSMFLSLVPLVGISLVAWPAGILLILSGQIWQGIFVIAAFILVIANIDTVLRPVLIPKEAQLNQALVILSVLGGLGLMGIVGALYGPVVMILLVTSIDVYTKYLLREDLEKLQESGRIDLKELGIIPHEPEEEQSYSQMFFNVLKNVSAPFRREEISKVEENQA